MDANLEKTKNKNKPQDIVVVKREQKKGVLTFLLYRHIQEDGILDNCLKQHAPRKQTSYNERQWAYIGLLSYKDCFRYCFHTEHWKTMFSVTGCLQSATLAYKSAIGIPGQEPGPRESGQLTIKCILVSKIKLDHQLKFRSHQKL